MNMQNFTTPTLITDRINSLEYRYASRTGRALEEVQQLITQEKKHQHPYTKKKATETQTPKKHKMTPDGSHYLVNYTGTYPVSFEIPIPVDWAKHWCEHDKRFNSPTTSIREWLSLESDLICIIVIHGDLLLVHEDRQFTLKEGIQQILTLDGFRLEIPILDKMLFDSESPIVNGYDYATDIFHIRTEIETGIKLHEVNMQGFPQADIDIPGMTEKLLGRYERKKRHMEEMMKA